MRVTLGMWFDTRMNVFDTQVYDSELSFQEILESVICDRRDFGHTPISITDTYAAFSDGTRLILTDYPIVHEVYINTGTNLELDD